MASSYSSSMLASCSNGLNVYQYINSELKEIVRSNDSNDPNDKVNGLSWNHTNQVIAIGGTGRKVRLIQSSNGALLSTIPFTDVSNNEYMDKEIGAISFSTNSRYLATGSGSILSIWDLKKRAVKSQFTLHKGNIRSLQFFPEGEIVSGDITGSIRIWDVKNETSSEEMNYIGTNSLKVPLRCLELSPIVANKLAAGYEDGSIVVWDATTFKNIRHQIVHKGIVMDLSYSPKNPRLVATAGFDGRLSLVDTAAKTINDPSAFIDIGDRLTSVSFNEDAIHCAIGTNSGNILIYDWRNVRKPVCKVEAHNPYPVRAIQFQLPLKPITESKAMSAESSVNSITNDKVHTTSIKPNVQSMLPNPISISTAPPIPPESTTRLSSSSSSMENNKVRMSTESNITNVSLSTLSIDSDLQNLNMKSDNILNRNMKTSVVGSSSTLATNTKRIDIGEELKSDNKEEEISKIFETEDKRNKSIGYFSPNNNRTINVSEGGDEFDSLRKSVKAVTSQEMQGIF